MIKVVVTRSGCSEETEELSLTSCCASEALCRYISGSTTMPVRGITIMKVGG